MEDTRQALADVLVEVMIERLRRGHVDVSGDYFLRQSEHKMFFDDVEKCYLIFDGKLNKFTVKVLTESKEEALRMFWRYQGWGPMA